MERIESFGGLRVYGLDVVLRSVRPLPRRGHHGGWLRGIVGHALFRGNCIYDEPRCAGCALSSGCPYPQTFKPHLLPGEDSRLPSYLIHDWTMLSDEPGVRFKLLLIGPALQHAENWIRQLDAQAPKLDIGGGGRGRLGAVRDLASGRIVFSAGCFRQGATLKPLELPLPPQDKVMVRLATPLVSKHGQSDLLLAPLRTRLQRLVNSYGDGASVAPAQPPWRVTESRLRAVTVPQGTGSARRVRGFKGELRLEGVTDEGARLLAAGFYLHAGAEVSQGFGRYWW